MPTLNVAIDARRARAGAQEFQAAAAQVQRGATTAATGVNTMGRSFDRVGVTAMRLKGILFSLFGGFGLVMVIRRAISTISSFEATMATLRGVAIRTNETLAVQTRQFEDLERAARQAGATTRYTASEAAEGLLFLARAGFSVQQAMAALPATLNLAQAGQLGLGEAADFASNILSQFGLQAEETNRVVDALVITSNRANTDVRQMAEAFKYAGPMAAALGLSVEDTAAAIGVLGDAGIQASMAGTGLRMVFGDLIQTTDRGREALDRMGLTLEELNPKTVGLVKAMELLRKHGMGAEEALDLFQQRGAVIALVLSKMTDKQTALGKAMDIFSGESAREAALKAETLEGKWRSLISAWEELTHQAGDAGIKGWLKDVVDGFTMLIRAMGEVGKGPYQLELAWIELKSIFREWSLELENIFKSIIQTIQDAFEDFFIWLEEQWNAVLVTLRSILPELPYEEAVRQDQPRRSAATIENERNRRAQLESFLYLQEAEAIENLRMEERRRALEKYNQRLKETVNLESNRNKVAATALEALLQAEEEVNAAHEKRQKLTRESTTQYDRLLDEALERVDATRDFFKSAFDDIGRSVGDTFTRIMTGAGDLKKTVAALLLDVRDILLKHFVSDVIGKTFSNMMTQFAMSFAAPAASGGTPPQPAVTSTPGNQNLGAGWAFGGVFSGGSPIPFGMGSVFSGPTLFPMRGGRTGMLGEAGWEGVLPLARDSQGRLGVHTVSPGGGASRPINVNMVVNTPNADSFRRSRSQIVGDLRRIAGSMS